MARTAESVSRRSRISSAARACSRRWACRRCSVSAMRVPLTARCSSWPLRRLSTVLALPRDTGAEAARPDASFSSAGFGSGSAVAADTAAGAGRGTGAGGASGAGAGDGLATDAFLRGVGGAEGAAAGLGPPYSSERRRSLSSCCLAERPRAVR
eukprot:scaffold97648_cov63-Phaeocystis_antarctica.AAC.2